MSRLTKAQDLYLRGFNGSYIRRRTGIFWTDLKKSLPDSSKEAIVRYQAAYIRKKWTDEEIKEAFAWLEANKEEAEKKASRRQLVILGCQFGQYQRVFRRIRSEMTT